ncbi:MAG: YHS domain-containing protein [Candidatus Micrarchaeota archaeon]|nr:YHS domain-containing protein [Candidatus Micrarchaeota archaeon]
MKDPVCGMEVRSGAKLRSSHMGRTYYFCSVACKQTFDKNPGAYAKN